MSLGPMTRLGLNKGGYFGERIDIQTTLSATLETAGRHGWQCESIPVDTDLALSALIRKSPRASKNIYISAGIHGDEPASPLAMRRLLENNRWSDAANFYLCPCLNPTGFPLNRRENAAGADLNRDYLHVRTAEVRAHIGWLERQPQFDVTLCLHEDWEAHGFYVYELNANQLLSLADGMIKHVAPVCPIDLSSVIEGRPARGGVISRDPAAVDLPQWPEAYYLIRHKTRLSYTLESPSDFPLTTRVAALVAGVESSLEQLATKDTKEKSG